MKEKKSRKFIIFSLIITFIILLTTIYYPYTFEVREYKIQNKNIPDSFVGLKIVHFSDVHYGTTIKENEFKNIVKKINDIRPDLVLFTGDLFDKNIDYSTKELDTLKKELGAIKSKLGKFAVTGNHDYKNNTFNAIMDESGFKIFKNSYSFIYHKDLTPIFIGGVPSSLQDKQDFEELFSYQLAEEDNQQYYKIILMHEPDNITKLNTYDIDLVLAGHSHNGQIRLPFIGAVITPQGAKNYYDDYYKVDKTDLFISGGLGTSTLPVRLLNKPSINLYRLYNN